MEKNSIFLKADPNWRMGEFTLPGQCKCVCFFMMAIWFGYKIVGNIFLSVLFTLKKRVKKIDS